MTSNKLNDLKPYQSVADFYAGKSVFITGGTGFIGKVFIEKLLYSCSHIDKIYILVRDKKGVSADRRIQEITQQAAFTRIKNERPDDLDKIVPVSGDISLPNLGIKSEEEQSFINKVSVVFHVAANIKFNESLDVALNLNVEGTRRVLNLCERMKNIQTFVQVSTAYTHPNQNVINEQMYPAPAKLSDVYQFIEQYGVKDHAGIKKLLNGRPNTYTFTKALAEQLVEDNHGDIPAVIVRPSVVSAAFHEPVPGWIDNWYGATGLLVSSAKGLNRVLYGSSDVVIDLIPVDYVTNLTIVAAARCNGSKKVTIYNSCSSECNPIKYKEMFEHISSYFKTNDMPYRSLIYTRQEWVLAFLTFLLQKMPAFVADTCMQAIGKKPSYSRIQSQVITSRDMLKFFTSQSWVVRSQKTRDLSASLSPSDRKLFPFNPVDIDWSKYIPVYYHGIRKYLLKK